MNKAIGLMPKNKTSLCNQLRDRVLKDIRKADLKVGTAIAPYHVLAKRYQVSLVTVQKAMNMLSRSGIISGRPGRGTVLAKDVSKVDFAEDVHLRKGYTFGLLITTEIEDENLAFMREFQGLKKASESHDGTIVLVNGLSKLSSLELDGLVIMGNVTRKDLSLLREFGKSRPVIVSGHYEILEHFSRVETDLAKALEETIDYFVDLGHKEVALVSDDFDNDLIFEEFRRNFANSLQERKLPMTENLIIDNKPENRNQLESILKRKPVPAIFATNWKVVRRIYNSVAKAGLSIPRDVSVVGYGENAFYLELTPRVTCIRLMGREVGKTNVELMIRMIEENDLRPRIIKNPGQLAVKESCSKPGR